MIQVFRTNDCEFNVFAFMLDDFFIAMIVGVILFKFNRS